MTTYDKIPLIIYGTNNRPIGHSFVAYRNCVTIWSYMNFDISVVSGECSIARISNKELPARKRYTENIEWTLEDAENYNLFMGTMFTGSDASNTYVLIVESDCQIKIGDEIYNVTLKLDNEFSAEIDDHEDNNWPQQHYNDLLVNYYLPTWEELEPAIFDMNVPDAKRELIKRMLLDFRWIIRKKGTIESIRLFFKFVNLNVTILEEYAHKKNNGQISKTTKPNRLTDWKTGDYHVILDNFTQEEGYAGYDSKNMPIRKLYIQDFKEFFEKLVVAIALADKYFTLPEQEISFFGIRFSSNAHIYQSIQVWGQRVCEYKPHFWQRDVNIEIHRHYTENVMGFLVRNKRQETTETYMSEVKAVVSDYDATRVLFFVDEEIYDDTSTNNNIVKYYSFFGNILHLLIDVPYQKYIEIHVENANNPEVNLTYEKRLVGSEDEPVTRLMLILSTIEIGTYNIRVTVWDLWNNRETYNYVYEISASKHEIDFQTFSSVVIREEQNELTLEPNSPSIRSLFSQDVINFILNQKDVPDDLSTYYDVVTQPKKELQINELYRVPDFNSKWILDESTETLWLEYLDSWIDIATLPYDATKELKLRIYNGDTCQKEIIGYDEITKYLSETSDKIFVTLMDITVYSETGETYTVPHYFITTTSVGLALRTNYDFVLVDKGTTNNPVSIYDNVNLKMRRMPLNYDIILFCRKSVVVPDFKHYISGCNAANGETVVLKSVFPRLINITEDEADNSNVVRFGDVVLCRLDERYVTSYEDVEWNLRDSFTKEVIATTRDEALKYRCNELTVYDVEVTFTIRGQSFRIYKESLFTSFVTTL